MNEWGRNHNSLRRACHLGSPKLPWRKKKRLRNEITLDSFYSSKGSEGKELSHTSWIQEAPGGHTRSWRMKRTWSENKTQVKPATSMQMTPHSNTFTNSVNKYLQGLALSRHCSKCFHYQLLKSSPQSLEVIVISILLVRRLRCKIIKKLAWFYSAVGWGSPGMLPRATKLAEGLPPPPFVLFWALRRLHVRKENKWPEVCCTLSIKVNRAAFVSYW